MDYINTALDLAHEALYRTSPNPSVGCVLVDKDGAIIGKGSTQRAGEAHAEVMALRDAAQQGHSTQGATAYVTLEPCSHHGRTGPCCDALIQAGVAKVVASIADPNPAVAGNGFARLRAAGIAVEVGPGAEASREMNLGFFSRMIRKTPWVRMKAAASLDGVTALPNGTSQWITGPAARADGHAWRARACAVLTGIGTVLADNPRLDVRDVPTERQPTLILVDSALEAPLSAQLFAAKRPVYIYTAAAHKEKRGALEAQGAIVISLPNKAGKVDLAAMVQDLGRRDINELHVEAGYKLNGSLLREGLVDELLVYLAPKLIGEGLGLAQMNPMTELSEAHALSFHSVDRLGDDLRILARVQGRDRF
ncbi:diaminohydroxyphosphoribosylaminopyrimidine deaminase/5-amino-6-(5-phosphoribosylamino)uracil reductase [Acidovorax sp. 107]|uniref:bifunctional diaminohydroxyphosphoribosylaminopyrimidine deaminase/5-amino-6-(5-phosphoribosylamino)uracil reductase RibD n=1 Tax=Acidovorax sp. 107 TaxID=2135638 RepID=UPI000D33C5E2|nr:bifunctional diaminohydroxyphosphoribosylaminopyrimidine deaminase/5-amino-6-(5-phosphoribosylamino)uracil reductase RibD [Acidovorax sp. 107]PUA97548.1 diaminohydroxyphosphoribosylaminopyrimidine deaminase/5-amino-6-(5-phosphoribosylamino)uracil reductase [Acidovorax sp. 107]